MGVVGFDVAVEAAEGLRDVLDDGRGPLVRGSEREQRLAEMAHDSRVPLTLLDLVLEGVEHGHEGTEALKREAVEPLLQRREPRDGLLVVLHVDCHGAPLRGRWALAAAPSSRAAAGWAGAWACP